MEMLKKLPTLREASANAPIIETKLDNSKPGKF